MQANCKLLFQKNASKMQAAVSKQPTYRFRASATQPVVTAFFLHSSSSLSLGEVSFAPAGLQ